MRALVGGTEPIRSADRQVFPTAASEPKEGDLIDFPERGDLPRFEIVSVRRDGLSRLVGRLVHLGRQS